MLNIGKATRHTGILGPDLIEVCRWIPQGGVRKRCEDARGGQRCATALRGGVPETPGGASVRWASSIIAAMLETQVRRLQIEIAALPPSRMEEAVVFRRTRRRLGAHVAADGWRGLTRDPAILRMTGGCDEFGVSPNAFRRLLGRDTNALRIARRRH